MIIIDKIDSSACKAPSDLAEMKSRSILLVFLPVLMALFINISNAIKLAKKRMVKKKRRPLPIIKINSVFLSQDEAVGSDCSSSSSNDYARGYVKNDSQDVTKDRMSKDKTRRDIRSVLCIFALILSAMAFEFLFHLRPFIGLSELAQSISEYLLPIFPLVNPILIFTYNKKLRQKFPLKFPACGKKKVVFVWWTLEVYFKKKILI